MCLSLVSGVLGFLVQGLRFQLLLIALRVSGFAWCGVLLQDLRPDIEESRAMSKDGHRVLCSGSTLAHIQGLIYVGSKPVLR